MKKYNIYCDESAINNESSNYMGIGGLLVERKHKKDLVRKLKSLKLKHNYLHEIKWNRVSPSSSEFYSDVVDFFLNNELRFWSIIVNKEEVDHDKFHQGSHEVAFWKFYYFLFKNRLFDACIFHIFLDKRNTKYKTGISKIEEFLNIEAQTRETPFVIQQINCHSSDEQLLIQIADFLIGAITHDFNGLIKSHVKTEIIKKIANGLGKDTLSFRSSLHGDTKINNFLIHPKNV